MLFTLVNRNGVEISVSWQSQTVHILGLNIDPDCVPLQSGLLRLREFRDWRAEEIGRRLAKAGIEGACEGARALTRGRIVSRTHFAHYLVAQGRQLSLLAPPDASLRFVNATNAHNDWLQAIAQGGVIGLVLLDFPGKRKLERRILQLDIEKQALSKETDEASIERLFRLLEQGWSGYGTFDEDGRFNPQYDENECQPMFGDTVIVAIGQSADLHPPAVDLIVEATEDSDPTVANAAESALRIVEHHRIFRDTDLLTVATRIGSLPSRKSSSTRSRLVCMTSPVRPRAT